MSCHNLWAVAAFTIAVQIIYTASAPAYCPEDIGDNVKKFGAKGDGSTDDSKAIRSAFEYNRKEKPVGYYYARPKAVYFPPGRYIISEAFSFKGCSMTIRGSSREKTTIRIKNNCSKFGDGSNPKAIITTPAGNLVHKIHIHDITLNTGNGNPGAIGLDFVANNVGSIKNVRIISGDKKGYAGISLSRYAAGPCLIRNIYIEGFDYGIKVSHTEYGPTFENIELEGQNKAGIYNEENICAIRKFTSRNSVPSIINLKPWSHIILLNARCTGGSSRYSAIQNHGHIYARDIITSGYRSALYSDSSVIEGDTISEYVNDSISSLFNSPPRSLNLAVRESPEFESNTPSQWIRDTVEIYGDIADLYTTFNSGKPTVYFRCGAYWYDDTVNIPAGVRRIVGFNAVINTNLAKNGAGLVFGIKENSEHPLIIEQFGYGITIDHRCPRTVAVKHGAYEYMNTREAGDVFFDDVVLGKARFFSGQKVWFRQLNTEGDELHIENEGAVLWILGVKTEGKGTIVKTTDGGATEVLGSLIYPCEIFDGNEAAAFINNESNQSLIFRSITYLEGGNYPVLIEEKRNGTTRKITTGGKGKTIPLFCGFNGEKFPADLRGTTLLQPGPMQTPYTVFVRPSSRMQILKQKNMQNFVIYNLLGKKLRGSNAANNTHSSYLFIHKSAGISIAKRR